MFFVHKSRKCPYFEPTLDYITLRNFGTVRPIFTKIASKVAQDSKEKSCKSAVRGEKNPRETSRGGGLGLNCVNKIWGVLTNGPTDGQPRRHSKVTARF